MDSRSSSSRADKVTNTLADAAIAHRKGDVAAAKRLYRKVLKAQPGNFKALRLSGALAHETGDLDEAIRLLSAAVRHAPPNETGALEDLGLLHLQTGELDKAEDLLRRALTIMPGSLVALTRLGTTLLTCGRGPEAIDVLARARAIDGSDTQLAYALAHALLESREFEKAIEVADAGLAVQADDSSTLVVKGVALCQLGRYGDAEAALEQSVSLAPADVNAWIHLGKARLGAGEDGGAIEAFAKAAELSPDLATAWSELANAHNASGRPHAAIAACDTFLGRHPTSAAVLLVKTLALRDAGLETEADALLGQDSLVVARQIEAPPRYENVSSFNDALGRMIRSHPSLARVHTNRATRRGIQTGSLMIEPPPEMRSFERLVDSRIRGIKQELRAAGNGDHPWIRHAPTRWLINAWGIILAEEGHQIAHMHPEAWMSGVYYVDIPDDGTGSAHREDGWIELGSLPEQLRARIAPPTRRVEPKPGLLLTFPSFIPHRTIPVGGSGERVSIAFDVFAAPG